MALLPNSLRDRLRLISIENKAILRGMSRVAVFLLLAKLIAAVKEILVAYYYGVNAVVDGYLFVFNMAMWPVSVFYSVASFVLIPYLVSMRTEQPEQEDCFRREILFVTLAFGIVASAVMGVVLAEFVGSGGAGLSAQGQQAAISAIPWLAPTVALGCLAALYSFWLMSEQRHANTFLEAMPALCIMLALSFWMFFAQPFDRPATPLVVGTFIGFGIQTGLLAYLSGYGFRVALPVVSRPHWQSMRNMFGAIILAQILLTSSGLVDQFFAVRMGEGVLAAYSYAQKVTSLVLGFGATVIGRALLPVLSGMSDSRSSWRIAKHWASWLSLLGFAGSSLLALIANPIVRMLFERGVFTMEDTARVSEVLVVLGMQFPFYFSTIVLIQWLGSVKQQGRLLTAAIAGVVAKVLCAFLLYDLGAKGLAWSTVVMYFVTTIVVCIVAAVLVNRSDRVVLSA